MDHVQIRKNFVFDRQLVEDAQNILQKRYSNLTQAFVKYMQAVVKDPGILDEIEKSASKREGRFIGLLNGKIGEESYKTMKKSAFENNGQFE